MPAGLFDCDISLRATSLSDRGDGNGVGIHSQDVSPNKPQQKDKPSQRDWLWSFFTYGVWSLAGEVLA